MNANLGCPHESGQGKNTTQTQAAQAAQDSNSLTTVVAAQPKRAQCKSM